MTEEATTVMTEDQIKLQMTDAVGKGDWSLVKKLAAELDKLSKAQAASAKAELLKMLAEKTLLIKETIDKAIAKYIDNGALDGADGVWYVKDFGEVSSSCRLTKAAKKTGEGGGSASTSSYVTDPRKSADLIAQVGEQVMFEKDTAVTIDKAEQVMPAGTTLKQAYEYSNNGGWRNRVRQALLKAADKAG